jgi:O-antigen/teichoic acid export membrane protein
MKLHWSRILRNMLSNWASYVVSAIVGFLLTPVVVHSLGATGYGLWTLVLSMTGYFGLLDLGIRSSVSRFLTRHLARGEQDGVNRMASSAFAILLGGGLLALLGTLALTFLFQNAFRVEPEYLAAARTALLITGLNISCILPLGTFSAVLYASERFDIVAGVTIATELIRAALIVFLLKSGFGLVALALTALMITLVQYTIFAAAARRLHPDLVIARRYVTRAATAELFGFSIYRFVWIVANQLIFYSDALVIGASLGAAAITPFAIAGSLINYARQIVFLVLDPFYPSAARMDASGDLADLRRLLIVGTRMALLVALPLCLGLLFLGRQFITLWMGEEYAGSAVLLMVLTIAQFAAMPQYVSTLVLAGMARHRLFAYAALCEGAANVALSMLLVQKMGLIGVAWGTVIPSLIINLLVVPFYTLRVLGMDFKDYFTQAYVRPLLCAAPVAVIAYGFSSLEPSSWFWFAAEGIVICTVFAVMSYFVCLYSEQRAAVTARLSALFRQAPAASV